MNDAGALAAPATAGRGRACIAAGEHPFIDGIVHGPDELVLCLGSFVEHPPYTSDYGWLDVYYESTRTRREDT